MSKRLKDLSKDMETLVPACQRRDMGHSKSSVRRRVRAELLGEVSSPTTKNSIRKRQERKKVQDRVLRRERKRGDVRARKRSFTVEVRGSSQRELSRAADYILGERDSHPGNQNRVDPKRPNHLGAKGAKKVF